MSNQIQSFTPRTLPAMPIMPVSGELATTKAVAPQIDRMQGDGSARALKLIGASSALKLAAPVAIRKTAATAAPEQKISIRLSGVHPSPPSKTGDGGNLLTLDGTQEHQGILYRIGYPVVPAVRYFVSADKASDIRVHLGAEELAGEIDNIAINQPSLIKTDEAAKRVAAEPFTGQYPPVRYQIEEAGSVRGQKQFMVSVYPAAVTDQGRVSLIKDIDIRVKDPAPVADGKRADAAKTFVFVVGEKFADAASLAAYKELKASMGYRVETIVVGGDVSTPDQIRSELQKLYRDPSVNLEHALIIGDFEDVPAPQAKFQGGVTDHYYRAIDTDSYEPDVNGPDIGVGRVPVANVAQLDDVIAKFTRYTKGDFSSTDWLSNVSFLATNDRYTIAEGSHNYVIDKHTGPDGLKGTFPGGTAPGGDKLYAITNKATHENVQQALAEGRAIVDYSGHGAKTFWDAPRFNQTDIRNLAHPDATPFVISNACITGDFRIPESFAETWIRDPHGAIMFWGSMDSTYWDEDDILERAMFDGIYDGGKGTFAEITQNALREHFRHYGGAGYAKYYWETYTTFGDPSIRLRIKK